MIFQLKNCTSDLNFGDEIANEDMGYLQWMRKNLDLDEDMAFSLDYYLG